MYLTEILQLQLANLTKQLKPVAALIMACRNLRCSPPQCRDFMIAVGQPDQAIQASGHVCWSRPRG